MLKKFFDTFLLRKKDSEQRKDGFYNAVANIGYRDKAYETFLGHSCPLSDSQISELYTSNGIAKRIVDCVVDDATRGLIETQFATEKELRRLNVRQTISTAGKLARLYGVSIVVAMVDDGKKLDQPIFAKTIKKISSLVVFDKRQIFIDPNDLDIDIYNGNYGKPVYFNILLPQGGMLKVHYSRCCAFFGDLSIDRKGVFFGGISVYRTCFEALKNYDILQSTTVSIVTDFIQVILKMNDLDLKMSSEGLSGSQIKQRIELLDRSRSVNNLILLDAKGEDYEKKGSNVSGLSELFDKYTEVICAATGIPATKLFGRTPTGLNNSGISDVKNWFDVVHAYRTDSIEPFLVWFFELLKNQVLWSEKPKDEDITWQFKSLLSPSDAEVADLKLKTAQTQAIYIDRGGVSAREAWQKTFGSGVFVSDIVTEEVVSDAIIDDLEDTEEELEIKIAEEENVETKRLEVLQEIDKILKSEE